MKRRPGHYRLRRGTWTHPAWRALTVLLSSLAVAAAGAAEDAVDTIAPRGARAECLELAAIVAEICPQRCTHKHCDKRCIPPLSADGQCQTCQDRCSEICQRQSERQAEHCDSAGASNGPAND